MEVVKWDYLINSSHFLKKKKRRYPDLAETTPAGVEAAKNTNDAIWSMMRKNALREGHQPARPIEVYLKQVGSPVKWVKR